MNAIFDSGILIDHLNGIRQAKQEMDLYPQKSVSIVTWIEVMAGTDASDDLPTRLFLQGFPLFPLTAAVAERTFLLRRSRKLKFPDSTILATAQVAGLLLVTRNSKDFSPTDPQIRIPYTIERSSRISRPACNCACADPPSRFGDSWPGAIRRRLDRGIA